MKQNIKKFFRNFEIIFSSIFLIITTSLVMINVVFRYFLNLGIFWSEEVATGCFVWSVFLGAAAGYKLQIHVGVDMLVNMCPPTTKKLITIIVDCILLLINGYITYIAIVYLRHSYTKPTPVLNISTAYISSSLFVSFALMTLYSIIFLIRDCKAPKEIKGEA